MNDSILNKELCFQLYVASKEVIKQYKPYLEKYDLTYTGFIVMLAINDHMTVNELGSELFLDSGTLSPLLKKLEKKRFIDKKRSEIDERQVELFLTKEGKRIKESLPCVSLEVAQKMNARNQMADYSLLLSQLVILNEQFKSEKES